MLGPTPHCSPSLVVLDCSLKSGELTSNNSPKKDARGSDEANGGGLMAVESES